MIGSCPFAYWDVEVEWEGDIVYYVRFKPRFSGTPGPVPRIIRLFLAGKALEVSGYRSQAFLVEGSYAHIYRRVLDIPYAKTATYGTIAREVHTGPRVVGLAMKRNPTPLLIPCHRVVAQNGIGGFSPDIRIKEELLALEKKTLQSMDMSAQR